MGEAAYASGTAGVLELLDSERVLLDVRLGLAQLRSDYVQGLGRDGAGRRFSVSASGLEVSGGTAMTRSKTTVIGIGRFLLGLCYPCW